jgi:DNA modification methylase
MSILTQIETKNQVLTGDSLAILKELDNETIDLTITSPPYFQQRDYGNGDFGVGNETTEEEYLENLLAIFVECVNISMVLCLYCLINLQ